jgi:hypothetical protein
MTARRLCALAGAVLLGLALGACNLGGAVEACSEDADCPEGSTCDVELEACVGPSEASAASAPDAGR